MKREEKIKKNYPKIPDLMFQDVKIPEALAPTPINPGIDEANQLNIPRLTKAFTRLPIRTQIRVRIRGKNGEKKQK